MIKKVLTYWYVILIGLFFICTIALYIYFGETSYLAVHDNLDLFVAQFQMMKNTGSFFAHHVDVPFLGGISRDNLPSEFSLYTMLYMIFPAFTAYIIGYFLKIIIAMLSVWLLAKDWLGEKYKVYQPLILLCGFAYGILNMFPTYGIPFATIPLIIYLLRKIYLKPTVWWYLALFFYPLVSYFSYFGFFILAYLAAACIWLSIRDKKVTKSLFLALIILAAGYVAWEYRLFGLMLFQETETIRSTMVEASLSGKEILAQMIDVWKHGMFHAESVHIKLVMPICMLYFIFLNGIYIKNRKPKEIFHDVYNLLMLLLVFNSAIYGIYFWGAFRGLIETLIPPLKGFQFNRTIFFSPFLWYASFFIILQRMYKTQKKMLIGIANVLALAAIAVILLTPSKYNDWYTTCHNKALELIKGRVYDEMNYKEFYSVDLFQEIKEDIGYTGEWSVAYGIHPAVLEYNGIATLDGYLGFYTQQYKEDFRKIIAPALERIEASRNYYDDWGARAYIYSGTDITAVTATKNVYVTSNSIYMDGKAFEDLGGRYVFSRIELDNADETGLRLVGSYSSQDSPYQIYLYER